MFCGTMHPPQARRVVEARSVLPKSLREALSSPWRSRLRVLRKRLRLFLSVLGESAVAPETDEIL